MEKEVEDFIKKIDEIIENNRKKLEEGLISDEGIINVYKNTIQLFILRFKKNIEKYKPIKNYIQSFENYIQTYC